MSKPVRHSARASYAALQVVHDSLHVLAISEQISVQDYAVAMIDELERPTHVRRRFTAGY
jgi:putative NADH-flavin reductase